MSQRQEVEASAYEKSATHRGALLKDLSLKGPARAETSTERKSIVHEQRPKPYWLIVNYEVSRMDVLTAHLVGSEEALPVFSFEEEAGMFFEHRALGTQWQVRETSAGELVSVLFGPCASAERVALDPFGGRRGRSFVISR